MKKYSGHMVLIPLAVGLLTITGWAFSIDALQRPLYSRIAMNPVTALCLILCSLAFFLDFKRSFSGMVSVVSGLMSMSVAIIGILRLVAVLGPDLHADSWLFHDAMLAATDQGTMSHMTWSSALCFVMIGTALRFGLVSSGRAKLFCSVMVLSVFVIGLFAFLSYALHIRHSYDVFSYIPMAFLTAVCFLCLSVAFLIENTENVFADKARTSAEKLSKA